VVRGGVLAAFCALLTGVGHVAGGGAVPELTALVVLVPLLAAVFVSLADRCRGPVGTILTLGAGQFVLHQLMQLLHAPHGSASSGTSMIGMHAVVTLVTAVALLHADAAVAALAGALSTVLPRPLTPPPARRSLPTLAVAGSDLPARIARQIFVAHARRGPPVGC
jgi:hypothetical protein